MCIYFTGGDEVRHWPVGWSWFATIHFVHERGPGWSSEQSSLGVGLDGLWTVESHPYTGYEVGGIADEPDVGPVVGRPCLAASGKTETGVPYGVVRGTTLYDVLHHADHDPRLLGRQHLGAIASGLPEYVMLGVLDTQDGFWFRAGTEGGEDGVGVDHLQRIDVSRADKDGRVRWDWRRDPKATRFVDDRLFA